MNSELLIGTIGQSAWRSQDSGASWARSTNGLFMEEDVRCLERHPKFPETIFAGTSRGCYRSDDRGLNWQRFASPMDDQPVWSVAIHPFKTDVMIAGTRPGCLFKTCDGGTT